jgi:hypothetical protein
MRKENRDFGPLRAQGTGHRAISISDFRFPMSEGEKIRGVGCEV